MSSRIKNTYNIVGEELGHGGMATVYLGEHKILHSQVAIKVLNDDLLHNKDIRNRFIEEARKLAHLKHSNLIVVKDFEDDHDFCAFVMEYVPGPTISQAIKNSRLSDERVAQFMSQLLHVCLYIHSKGIIHRDIKPSNVIIGPHEQLKLVDFGIAKDTKNIDGTLTTHVMGTPSYMSPEQIKSTAKVTAQSDIWSLGILLWEMVSGRNIFDTQKLSIPEIQSKIMYELIPSTGTKWDRLILKATQKDLSLRYLNCKEMLDDLLLVMKEGDDYYYDDEEETEIELPSPSLPVNKKKKPYVLLGLVALAIMGIMAYVFIGTESSTLETQPSGIFDAENNLYDTVKIGNQVWTTTNYRCTTLKDGAIIQQAKTEEEWENASRNGQPAWCYHEDWNLTDSTYGKLYNWYAVKQLAVPDGFQIATAADWDVLHDFIGKNSTSGLKLISGDNWDSGQRGDNVTGFGAIPTGYRNDNNKFADESRTGVWWTSSMFTNDVAIGYAIADTELKRTNYLMKCGFSVRLVKTSVKRYKLGEKAFGGYVFQLNKDETGGKICTVSPYNSPRNLEDALFFCGQLIIEGFSGWYLPSIDELNSMYLIPEIRKTFSINEYYWSSTNLDPNSAYWYSFAYGKYYAKDINEKGYVRPIRKF